MPLYRVSKSNTVISSPELDIGCFTVDLSSIHWVLILSIGRTNFTFKLTISGNPTRDYSNRTFDIRQLLTGKILEQ